MMKSAIIRRSVIKAAAMVLIPGGGLYASSTDRLRARYSVTYRGLRVSKATLDINHTVGNRIDLSLKIRADGAGRFLNKNKVTMKSQIILDSSGSIRPLSHAAVYEKDDRTRDITIVYGADGAVLKAEIVQNGRIKQSPVSAELTKGSHDPLAALCAIRQRLLEWDATGIANWKDIKLFDGRKLSLMALDHNSNLADKDGITIKMQPLAGYDEDDDLFSTEFELRLSPAMQFWPDKVAVDGLSVSLKEISRV